MVTSSPAYYEAPAASAPMRTAPATPGSPMPGPAADGSPFNNKVMSAPRTTSGTLVVNVPADAKIFVNGLSTTSTGTQRTYISKGLIPGQTYSYEIRAELVRDGHVVTDTKTVKLTAGQEYAVAFNLDKNKENVASEPVKTKVTLRVPADAKVSLAGNPTSTPGEVREFSTSKLAPGTTWENYTITVTLDRDGKTLTKEQMIALTAGESRELTFDFDSPQVASADSGSSR